MPTTKAKPAAPAAAPKATTIATRTGVVESDKRDKTRTVVVSFKFKHAKYGKYIARRSTLQVHDALNQSRVGDTVEVKACRPLSKTKFWTLVRVLEKSTRVEMVG